MAYAILTFFSRFLPFPYTLPNLKCSYLGRFLSDFKDAKTHRSVIKRRFRIVTEHLSRCFGLENPVLLVVELRFLRKNNFSFVTPHTHKETSAVSEPGMLGQV